MTLFKNLEEYIQFQNNQSTPKLFLSINNKTQCVPLLCLLLRVMTHSLSFVVCKLCFEKTPLNLQL